MKTNMKITLTVYELWFWRIGVVVALFLSILNYSDNRKQDNLLFKSIDEQKTTVSQINSILEIQNTLLNGQEITNKAIIKLLKNDTKD